MALVGGEGLLDMKMKFNLSNIRNLAAQGRLAFKRHTFLRMHQRKISVTEIQEALEKASTIVEEYPNDYPLPSCLILGYTQYKKALHIVAALDLRERMMWVITVYEPSGDIWEKDFTRRRKR